MVKLDKLSDRELALRMSKYIAELESIKVRAEYYSFADGCAKEKAELAADYARVRDALREEARMLSFMPEKRNAMLRDKYAPSVVEAAAWGLYADSPDEYPQSVDDALARLTKYYSYDYWRIIAEM